MKHFGPPKFFALRQIFDLAALVDQRGPTRFDLRPFCKNVNTCGPLLRKWCVNQQIHKI